MKLTDFYLDVRPDFIVLKKYLGQKVYTINYNIRTSEENDGFGGSFKYNSITLPNNQYDRSTVISAVIRQKYSDDEMQAIINNYLLDPDDTEAVAEFNQMQQYRKFAKKLADEFIEAIKED